MERKEENRQGTGESAGGVKLEGSMVLDILASVTDERDQLKREAGFKDKELEELRREYRGKDKELEELRSELAGKNEELRKFRQGQEERSGADGQTHTPGPDAPREISGRRTGIPKRRLHRETVFAAFLMTVCVAAAVCFFALQEQYKNSYHQEVYHREKTEEQLRLLQAEYGQLEEAGRKLQEKYDRLSALEGLGYGSEYFYAEKGVVVLAEGETETVAIHADLDAVYWMRLSDIGIRCRWSDESVLSSSWIQPSEEAESVEIQGDEAGVYTILFTNERNEDTFSMLIIVREEE